MRTLVFSIATCAAVLGASIAPAAAQTVSTALGLTNAGPVTSCPALIKVGGVINVAKWPSSARQIQYKWTFKDLGDQPTETIVATGPAAITVSPVSKTVSAGFSTNGWAQLSVTFPTNFTSDRINFTLTCPTPGSLGLTNGASGGSNGPGATGVGLPSGPSH